MMESSDRSPHRLHTLNLGDLAGWAPLTAVGAPHTLIEERTLPC
jgi:hypothetical protein